MLVGGMAQGQAQYVPSKATDLTTFDGTNMATVLNNLRLVKPVVISSAFSGFLVSAVHRAGDVYNVTAGAGITALAFRSKWIIPNACEDLQVVFSNQYMVSETDTAGGGPVTITASIEDATGALWACTLRGNTSAIASTGYPVIFDPVSLRVAAGTTVWVRGYVTFAAGTNPVITTNAGLSGEWGISGTAAAPITDPTQSKTNDTANATAGGGGWYLGACAILGKPVGKPSASVAVFGDSLSVQNPHGYIFDAFSGILQYMHLGFGQQKQIDIDNINGQFRAPLIPYATHAYIQLGTNDFRTNTAITAQTLINNEILLIQRCVAAGLKPVCQTITPYSLTSSDSYLTTSGQTQAVNETAREGLNDWIRGVSLTTLNSTYSISLGTLTAKATGMIGFVEVADGVETTRNSGKWKTTLGPGGTATSATTTTLVDSGKTWTASQYVGWYVAITSGTGAGQQKAITANSVTSITVTAWTTQPDVTSVYQIYAPCTTDGTHPSDIAAGNAGGYQLLHGLITAATFPL